MAAQDDPRPRCVPEDSLQQLEMPQAHHIALLDKLIQATRMYATYLLISRIGKI
jgi:hypothetical protein